MAPGECRRAIGATFEAVKQDTGVTRRVKCVAQAVKYKTGTSRRLARLVGCVAARELSAGKRQSVRTGERKLGRLAVRYALQVKGAHE